MSFNIDFLVVGSRKCGTTWLYENMLSHPEICLSRKVKQSNYFGRFYNKPLKWYSRNFEPSHKDCVFGEIDADIITFSGSAGFIFQTNPNTKIIIILRDPVKMFESSYLHSLRKGDVTDSPENTWENDKRFFNEVSYGTLVKPFYELFNKSQIKILFYDQLALDATSFLSEIYNYIGVESIIDEVTLNSKKNKRRLARVKIISLLVTRLARYMRSLNFHNLVNYVKKTGLEKVLSKDVPEFNNKIISDDLKLKIEISVAQELALFEDISNISVPSQWGYDNGKS